MICPEEHRLKDNMCTIKPKMTCPSGYELKNDVCAVAPTIKCPEKTTLNNTTGRCDRYRGDENEKIPNPTPPNMTQPSKPPYSPPNMTRPIITPRQTDNDSSVYSDIKPFKLL